MRKDLSFHHCYSKTYVAIALLLLYTTKAQLVMQAPVEDQGEKLKYGQATCISSNGRRVAIGANGYEKFKGTMYIYEHASGSGEKMEHWRRVRLCGNGTKTAEERRPRELRVIEKGSGFGFACAFTANARHLIVGAPGHSLQRGAVFVFRHNKWTGDWQEVAKLEDSTGRSGDSFGWSVTVSDTCSKIFVSAKGRRANNGEVIIFSCKKKCTECTLVNRLTPPDFTDSLGPQGIRIRNNFGISIAINGSGNKIAVGCTGFKEEKGTVYIFGAVKGKKEWKLLQRLESPNAQKFGFFGYKVSLTKDGNRLAVGADGEDNYRGTVYVFDQGNRNDKSGEFHYSQKITAERRAEEDNFGGALSFSSDGRALAIGAPGASKNSKKDTGALFLYEGINKESSTSWELAETIWPTAEKSSANTFFAWSVGLSSHGDKFVATAPDSHDGTGTATIGFFKVTGRKASSMKQDIPNYEKEDL